MAELKQPDQPLETVVAESPPPSRRAWTTPRVIESLIDQTEAHPGVAGDGAGSS
jgi:hypothetical protein